MKLKGKVALVTGGGRGIGAATALRLARQGASVAITSRTERELDDTARAIIDAAPESSVLSIPADVAEEHSVQSLFEQVREELGPVDILVNNAAIIIVRKFEELSLDDWERTFAVNVRGAFLCAREAFKDMRKKGGVIINVSSLAGIVGAGKFPGFSAYSASKHAVVGLTEALAEEGKPYKIRVHCVAPGAVDTEMLRRNAPDFKTSTKPDDIAQVIETLIERKDSGFTLALENRP